MGCFNLFKAPFLQKINIAISLSKKEHYSYYKRHYLCTLSFAKPLNCLNFLKQQNNLTDLLKVIGFKVQ